MTEDFSALNASSNGPMTKDEERVRFASLSYMRHEMRTPVNAILGYCELLIEDEEEAEEPILLADLRRIKEAGDLLLARINEVLSASLDLMISSPEIMATLSVELRQELRDPLSVVTGYGGLLLERCEDRGRGEAVPDLRRIVGAAERLLAFLNESVHVNESGMDAPDALGAAEMIRETVASIRPVNLTHEAGLTGTILLAEDNDLNRHLLVRRLERLGHEVVAVTNGRDALEHLQAEAVDLVLLDLIMPEMNGYEALARMKADPTLREIPVLMVSALDELDSVVRCIEAGAEDYLSKPCDPVLLRARVAACLEKKRLRDRELEVLRGVALLTDAAASVEAGDYQLETLPEVSARPDSLGQLARVFEGMAREVDERERRLKRQVERLTIEIDSSRKEQQVREITETDFFREIRQKARALKEGRR